MRLHIILLAFAIPALVGCFPSYQVTISQATEVYSGTLKFDGPYTGNLTIPKGPGGESFSGRYVATEMTTGVLAVGGAGEVNARGVWTGRGTSGSILTAEVKVGRSGHGIGTAKDSNGKEYQISF